MAPRASASPKRLAVLLSGSGTTLQNLIDRIQSGTLRNAQISVVLSSRAGAGGLERARKHDIPTVLVESKRYRSRAQYGNAVLNANIVLCKAKVHPSLIPAFSGEGMYGDLVHRAVVKRGVKVTGCTVHFVTNEYDAGPIILQKVCNVSSSDSWESVRDKVVAAEREALPEAIQLLIDDRLKVTDGIVEVVDD